MYCKSCGNQLQPNSVYCNNCGDFQGHTEEVQVVEIIEPYKYSHKQGQYAPPPNYPQYPHSAQG